MNLSDLEFRQKKLLPESLVHEVSYQVRTRGYALVPEYLSAAECDAFKTGLEKALDEYDPRGVARRSLEKEQIHDLLLRDVAYNKLLDDPRLQQLVSPFLTDTWIMYGFTTSSLPPNGTNYAGRIHVDSPRWIPGYITNMSIMFTLDEFTHENGATQIVPGSQHASELPSPELFEKMAIETPCPKGSFIIFNSRTFHRAGRNSTSKWRHSLTLNACRPFMKQRMDWARMIPAEFLSGLGPQAKRVLGFDTRLPASMDEYFLPEGERLYKPGQEKGQL